MSGFFLETPQDNYLEVTVPYKNQTTLIEGKKVEEVKTTRFDSLNQQLTLQNLQYQISGMFIQILDKGIIQFMKDNQTNGKIYILMGVVVIVFSILFGIIF